MANFNLKITIPAGGKMNFAAALPQPTGGAGNVVGQPPIGNIFVQQMIPQNQSAANNMMIGDAATTSTNGLQLTPSGSANMGAFINYGTYLSDWWVVGTPGDVLFVLYIP